MAEFMKDGGEFIKTQQCRLISSRFADIGHNTYKWPEINPILTVLSSEFCHPRSTSFALTREKVCIEECKMLTISIKHIEYFYIWMINRNIVPFIEMQSIKFRGKGKYSIYAFL